MPLAAASPREELHLRRIDLRGYRREDGLFDIEAHLVDTKTYEMVRRDHTRLAAGSPVHDMWVRLVIDENLTVRDAIAATDASPYALCREATATLSRVIGLRIAAGWSKAIKDRLGGAEGCTHLTELLLPLATVAYQTLHPLRAATFSAPATVRPAMLDTCYAYSRHRDVIKQGWPLFYEERQHAHRPDAQHQDPQQQTPQRQRRDEHGP